MKLTTLCFLVNKDEVLLAMKKRGFGVDKYNGVGGKVGDGESIKKATVREAEEEVAVKISETDLEQRAVLHFSFDGNPDWNQECHVFVTKKWLGKPAETEEMRPEWFSVAKLPFEKMWVDDPLWLPKVLSGESFEADFVFDAEGKTVLSYNIKKRMEAGLIAGE